MHATPIRVRMCAAEHPERCAQLSRATHVAPLLQFVISDLDLSSRVDLAQLFQARLLPMADGKSMAAIMPVGSEKDGARMNAGVAAGEHIYIVMEQLEHLLVESQGGWYQTYV